MVVSYKKLWKLLIDLDMRKKDLQQAAGVKSKFVCKMHQVNIENSKKCA